MALQYNYLIYLFLFYNQLGLTTLYNTQNEGVQNARKGNVLKIDTIWQIDLSFDRSYSPGNTCEWSTWKSNHPAGITATISMQESHVHSTPHN